MSRLFNLLVASSLGIFLATPLIANAGCDPRNRVCDLLIKTAGLIDVAIGIAASLALLVFFWGIVKYIASAGKEDAKSEGRKIMIWGVVALFVLFSTFGLVRFIQTSFGLDAIDSMRPPQVELPGSTR